MEKEKTLEEIAHGYTFDFYAPDGNTYTIREQTGADDDLLSNPIKARDLTNMAEFIAAIIVKVNGTPKRLTVNESFALPANVRYAIMIASRIFSLGNEVDFEHIWEGEEVPLAYTVDLNDHLFNNYSTLPTEEEVLHKTDAVPYYPIPSGQEYSSKNIEITLTTGKRFLFDRFDGFSERAILLLPEHQRTINKPLEARNLRQYIDGEYVKVTSFHTLTARELRELRDLVYGYDPVYKGEIEINHPSNGKSAKLNLMGLTNFFFPGEA